MTISAHNTNPSRRSFSRRTLLAGTIVAVPTASLAAVPALAAEDAALRRLWADWLTQLARAERTREAYQDAQEKAFDEVDGSSDFEGLFSQCAVTDTVHPAVYYGIFKPRNPARGKPWAYRCEATTPGAARVEFRAVEDKIHREYKKAIAQANARYRVKELDAVYSAEVAKMFTIEAAIAKTPAEGMFGLAVKLAVVAFYILPDPDNIDENISLSAHHDLTRLVGADFAEQARAVERIAAA